MDSKGDTMQQKTIFDFIPRHDAKCEICGNPILKPSRFKPRKYCGDECANYARFKDALEKAILKLHPTKEAKTVIRGDMFRLANILSKSTNTAEESA